MDVAAVSHFLSRVTPFSLLTDDVVMDISHRVDIQQFPVTRFVFRQDT